MKRILNVLSSVSFGSLLLALFWIYGAKTTTDADLLIRWTSYADMAFWVAAIGGGLSFIAWLLSLREEKLVRQERLLARKELVEEILREQALVRRTRGYLEQGYKPSRL